MKQHFCPGMAVAGVAFGTLLALALFGSPALAQSHAEAEAKEALQKAIAEYASSDYGGAAARLEKAAAACGAKGCTPQTKGAVLRDLGAMQFRAGDKDGAGQSWADALALDPALTLNPAYDASDVGAAWEDARAAAGLPAGAVSTKPPPAGAGETPAVAHGAVHPAAGPSAAPAPAPVPPPPPLLEPLSKQPTGDFEHRPAAEQREDTPLPIHVEYPGKSPLARVVVKYKGAHMREWARVELARTPGGAYEGMVPCVDVLRGVMHYWVQGFDKAGEPLAATGDPKHTYWVMIRDKIATEPPHLPGKEAPRSCEEADCPPGLPGCQGKKSGGEGEAAEETRAAAAGEVEDKDTKKGVQTARWWVGVSLALDFLPMPSASNVCERQSDGAPVNPQGYFCYDSAKGADFPSQAQNPTLSPTGAGTAAGALQAGNVRAMVAVDYALTANILAGARLGYVFNAYPGSDAIKAGQAIPPIHAELRGTYLLGKAPLTRLRYFTPMAFVGLGLGEFDGHQATRVQFNNQPTKVVDAWLTDAPFFIVLGGGARYQLSARVALTAALRLNMVIGGNGFLPTFGPEIGGLYAF